ncbi:hypothetical protein HYX08_00130 [Candidatus Woesearchaeota archaeon]|nr:hypothetical protein [Candidatus Woesearchaeota archaeon]
MIDKNTILIIFISTVVSSVSSVMLNKFMKTKKKFHLKEIWDYLIPSIILTIYVFAITLLVVGIIYSIYTSLF